jgi:hypothetical protein
MAKTATTPPATRKTRDHVDPAEIKAALAEAGAPAKDLMAAAGSNTGALGLVLRGKRNLSRERFNLWRQRWTAYLKKAAARSRPVQDAAPVMALATLQPTAKPAAKKPATRKTATRKVAR